MAKTNAGLVAHAQRALSEKWGYVWGTFGNVLTKSLLDQKAAQYPKYNGGAKKAVLASKWLNHTVSDCVGLIKGYAMWDDAKDAPVYKAAYDVNTGGMYSKATEKGPLSTLPELPGVCVYMQGHIGVYIGGGWVIECKGGVGVIKSPLRGAGAQPWTHWLKCPFITYAAAGGATGPQEGTAAGTSTQQAFIAKIGPMAAQDMKQTGILASLTIAQAILESGWGKSGLTVAANNLFGIKGSYNGASYSCKTQEWDGSKYVTVTAAFRKYPSWAESLADHSALFLRLDRYANLRGCTDYRKACQYVREDGYATDPNYTAKLVQIIEQYGLTKYDTGAGGVTPPESGPSAATSPQKGDRVQFNGGAVYTSANAASAATTKGASVCKVTQTASGKHPLHLISEDGKGVYGWVDAANVAAISSGSAAPAMRVGAKVQYSGRLYANSDGGGAGKSVSGSYTVSRILAGKKCGVLLNGRLGWVPESACKVIG